MRKLWGLIPFALCFGQGCPGPSSAALKKSDIPEGAYGGTGDVVVNVYVAGALVNSQTHPNQVAAPELFNSDRYPLTDDGRTLFVGYSESRTEGDTAATTRVRSINAVTNTVAIEEDVTGTITLQDGTAVPLSGQGSDTYTLRGDGTLHYVGTVSLGAPMVNGQTVSETISVDTILKPQ